MKKRTAILLLTLISTISQLYAQENQSKLSAALGFGYRQSYNDMLYPYEFRGNSYYLNIGWQKQTEKGWLSDANFNVRYSTLFSLTNPSNIKGIGELQQAVGFNLQVMEAKRIAKLCNNKFLLYAGGNIDANLEYQAYSDSYTTSIFYRMGLSLGASFYMEYHWGKTTISNNTSTLLISGLFYPHYQSRAPFYSLGSANDYFQFTTVGELNCINNRLKVEFPIFINNKLVNTFYLAYNFGYENSTIRDNPIIDYNHAILLGMVFKFSRLQYN